MSVDFVTILNDRLKGNIGIKTVIITDAGDYFCAGADVAEFLKLSDPVYLDKFLDDGRIFMDGLSKKYHSMSYQRLMGRLSGVGLK